MYKSIFLVFFLGISCVSYGEQKYFNGKVARIETCTQGGTVYLFVKEVTGTSPSSANGCSNDLSFPYVKLNSVDGEVSEVEKVIVSTALSAQASDRAIRVRFDDQNNQLISIAMD